MLAAMWYAEALKVCVDVVIFANLDVRGRAHEPPLPTLADVAAAAHLEAVGQQLGGLGLKLLQGQALLDHLHCLTPSQEFSVWSRYQLSLSSSRYQLMRKHEMSESMSLSGPIWTLSGEQSNCRLRRLRILRTRISRRSGSSWAV